MIPCTFLPSSPLKILHFCPEEWQQLRVIYNEHYTKVILYIHKKTKHIGALKLYQRSKMNEREIKRKEYDFQREIKIHLMMDGIDHTLPLWFWFKTENEWGLMTKYMNHSFLLHRIYSYKTEDCMIYSVIYPLLKGVEYLHENRIIHRDIKPENIFIHHHKVYLGDFGYSYILSEENSVCGSLAGTLNYMAPELLAHYIDKNQLLEYRYEVDIWSIGMIVYELLFHTKPFGWSDFKHYTRMDPTRPHFILKCLKTPLLFPSTAPTKNALNFIEACLHKNPHERATINELLRHPWIQTYLKNKKVNHLKNKCLQEIKTKTMSTTTMGRNSHSVVVMIADPQKEKTSKAWCWRNQCTMS